MKKTYLIFVFAFFIIAIPLFIFPINLFSGQIIYDRTPQKAVTIDCKLSLSYFIGLGYENDDMKDVKSFYLTKEGYSLAFKVLICFPFLLAFFYWLFFIYLSKLFKK